MYYKTMDTTEKLTKENLYTGLKVLLIYIGQYRKEITVLSIMGIFSAIGNGAIPYIVGLFFDSIAGTGYLSLLILWGVIQFITYLLDWIWLLATATSFFS